MVAQDLGHVQHQVAEVGRVQHPQPVLVFLIQFPRPTVRIVRILGSADAGGGQAAVLPPLDRAHEALRRPALGVDPLRLHHLFQDAHLVVRVQDGEIRLQPDMFRVPAQHPRAQGMEGAEPEALGGLAKDGGDAVAHFPRGLVREGDGQHLIWKGAPCHQDMGKARGQHAGLARAGAGEHEQGTVNGLHRLPLFGVQAGQVFGHGLWPVRMVMGYRTSGEPWGESKG